MSQSLKVRRFAWVSLATVAAGLAAPAFGQEMTPPEQPDEQASTAAEAEEGAIVVTGSRIRRDQLSQDAPMVVVDGGDIAKNGLDSINDVLQRLPLPGGGSNSKFNNTGNPVHHTDRDGVGAKPSASGK